MSDPIPAETVSALAQKIAAIAQTVDGIAAAVAAMQPGSVVGVAAGVVHDAAQVAIGEATGDPAKAQAAESAALDDFVSRVGAYEKAHSVDLVSMIHAVYTKIFG